MAGEQAETPAPSKTRRNRAGVGSVWVLVVALVGLSTWMLLGVGGTEDGDKVVQREPVPVRVETELSQERVYQRQLRLDGDARPADRVTVVAARGGFVTVVPPAQGELVAPGELLLALDATKFEAALETLEATLDRRSQALARAQDLRREGISTATQLEEAEAALAEAESNAVQSRLAVERSEVRAPIAGRLISRLPTPGSYVTGETELGEIIDQSRSIVVADVPQTDIGSLRIGMDASVAFATGQERTGRISFIASAATPASRTFPIEVEVENANLSVPTGITAELTVNTGEDTAHFVNSATLTLSPDGARGLKLVEQGNVVSFVTVDVLEAAADGIWVTGLPPEARIITVGQGFVSDGDIVETRASEHATVANRP